jgi:hypothetical protein
MHMEFVFPKGFVRFLIKRLIGIDEGGNRSKSGIFGPVTPRKAPEIANKTGPPPVAPTMKNVLYKF